MRRLVTPGEILSEEFLKPLHLSAHALATALHVPPARIRAIIQDKTHLSADTALRLGRYFGTNAEFWMNLRTNYELAKARRAMSKVIEREVPIRGRSQ